MYLRLSSLTRDRNRLESLNRGTVKLASLAYCPAKEKWEKPGGSTPKLWLLRHRQTILGGSSDISSGAAEFRPTERLGMRLPRPVRIALLTILAITALAAPLVVWTERGLQSMFNAPLEWVPPTFEARRTFQEFVEQFQLLRATAQPAVGLMPGQCRGSTGSGGMSAAPPLCTYYTRACILIQWPPHPGRWPNGS